MKNIYTMRFTLWAATLLLGLSGCLKDDCDSLQIYYQYNPVYMTEAQLRSGFEISQPRPLENPGKIYFYDRYVFINEVDEGVHVFDNSDPRSPKPVSFIKIPGNVDMAVAGDIMYADSYVDLVAVDISNPAAPKLASRSQNVFPGLGRSPSGDIVVRYEKTEITRELPCNTFGGIWFAEGDVLFIRPQLSGARDAAVGNSFSNSKAAALGIGGSLARFTLAADHLYTIDNDNLHVFDISNLAEPQKINTVYVGWMIETIFPYGKNLFIGGRNGMFIFDNSEPTKPQSVSVFQHARACDPVFIDGNTAYVTLRDGTECESFNNQLDVVDISDLRQPRLLRSYPMHHPIGLSVMDNHLYICEDDQGVKVFNVESRDNITDRLISHLKGFTAYDIIILPDDSRTALVIGKDGLYQFDVSNPKSIKELSVIPVTK